MANLLILLAYLAGAALLLAGVAAIYVPAAYIVGGAGLIAVTRLFVRSA